MDTEREWRQSADLAGQLNGDWLTEILGGENVNKSYFISLTASKSSHSPILKYSFSVLVGKVHKFQNFGGRHYKKEKESISILPSSDLQCSFYF